MGAWLTSIIGVVFLLVLMDIICPDGKVSAFIKSIFGIFAVAVIISPILRLDIGGIFDTTGTVSMESFDTSIKSAKDSSFILKLKSDLKNNQIIGVDVEIDSTMVDFEYEIENIYIDTTNLVLTENLTNINKYEVIGELVHSLTEISLDRIVVYG